MKQTKLIFLTSLVITFILTYQLHLDTISKVREAISASKTLANKKVEYLNELDKLKTLKYEMENSEFNVNDPELIIQKLTSHGHTILNIEFYDLEINKTESVELNSLFITDSIDSVKSKADALNSNIIGFKFLTDDCFSSLQFIESLKLNVYTVTYDSATSEISILVIYLGGLYET